LKKLKLRTFFRTVETLGNTEFKQWDAKSMYI
jgi:hypothetical protein